MNSKEDPIMVGLEQMIIAKYLELHVTFLILEQRVSGDLSAWEGILLIKERKNDSETSKASVTT